MEKRIVTITTTDRFFKDDDCEFVSERPEKTIKGKYIYDLKENKEKEVKYIVKRAYSGKIGSIITAKPIDFSKDKTYLVISEIIFWEQVPENDSSRGG